LLRPVSARQVMERASFNLLPGWELVTNLGIAKNEQAAVWHGGHVTDVLSIDGERLLLASASAGVWLVSPDESVGTSPLSVTWPKVDIRCLGRGNRGSKHFFAGGDEGVLFETGTLSLRAVSRLLNSNSAKDMGAKLKLAPPFSLGAILDASDAPIFDWKQIPFVGPDGALLGQPPINRLVCLSGLSPAKLVLATDIGVFWSDVPAFGQGYRFVRAEGIPANRCWGVAEAAGNTVVASPTGDLGNPKANGMYFGTWQGHRLLMQRATHLGNIDFVKWNDTMLASSAGNRSILYAVVSDNGKGSRSLKRAFRLANLVDPPLSVRKLAGPDATPPISVRKLIPVGEAVYTVIRSQDAGKTWAPVGPHGTIEESVERFPRFPGFYQYGTLCIAVSHADANTIAVGTRTGPLIGRNTPDAFLWEDHGDEDTPGGAGSPHLHGDLHGLAFDPTDPTGKTLYICGDGGFVLTKDLARTFFSLVNSTLPNLQFQSYPAHPYLAPFTSASNGASGASLNTPGLVAGPLQDNGVVYSFQLAGTQTLWQVITSDDDGLLGVFLKGDLLLYWNNDRPTARVAKSLGAQFGPEVEVAVRTPSRRVGAGSIFSNPFAEPVFRPAFRKPGTNQLMIAVAAYDANNAPFQDLWGLFSDDDGGNPVWDFLASPTLIPGDSITAAACDDGHTVLAGTQTGQIFTLDTGTGVIRQMPFGPCVSVPFGQVYQLALLGGSSAIARYQSGLLRLDPASGNWVGIGGNGLPSTEGALFFMAVDTGRNPAILYLATDFGVHASWDAGANWLPVSQGLPVRSHPATLRCVTEPGGKRRLYLFTFGWSAWRTLLN
jgi:hypothetical protein